ncbi:NDMA-dependent alcohol dehydrogenase [Tomitella biformata]|uniref:NDMA-dependent alcohol dehydrogenase n=1 Tax=Tomitella biformata TaxID=630403 RepID=UPI000464283F|nr:NDMA-dependent alcohol dehydrogenase [Tomitella biformata]
MKTKGAILRGINQPWSVEEIEVGDPRAGEVMVELGASGMCHSDHHLVTGDTPMPSYPVMGGHEGAGKVIKVGEGVKDINVGDHVVLSFIPSCGKCESCVTGHSNLCDLGMYLLTGQTISDGTYRVQTAKGEDVIPMVLLGTFSPYVTAHETAVIKIDESIPFEVACLVGCGVTTGWGSATNVAEVKAGETVIVVGAGGVGMNSVQGAAVSGAERVIVIDPSEFHREQSKKFGATHTFNSMAEAIVPIMELTHGKMADKTIITVGRIKGEDIDPAMTLTRKGGRVVVVGMGGMGDMDVTLNLFMFTMLQKELRGAIFGGANPRAEIPNLLSMYKAGKLNLDDLVTKEYQLEQINEAYQDMLDGKIIRGVIKYTDADR